MVEVLALGILAAVAVGFVADLAKLAVLATAIYVVATLVSAIATGNVPGIIGYGSIVLAVFVAARSGNRPNRKARIR